MELLNKQETITTTVVFTLQDETGAFYYKEWINDGGEVVDSMMVDKDGYQINDPILMEQVLTYLESIGE